MVKNKAFTFYSLHIIYLKIFWIKLSKINGPQQCCLKSKILSIYIWNRYTHIHNYKSTEIDDLSELSDCASNDGTLKIVDKSIDFSKNVTITTIIKLLTKYGLDSAFPNLYIAYRALAIIPASSASAERSFSKVVFSFAKLVIHNKKWFNNFQVKLIKTRLRSIMGQRRLENLLLLSCERDVPMDIIMVIDTFAQSSDLLRNALTFK